MVEEVKYYNIRREIRKRGLAHNVLAEKAGVSKSMMSLFLSGKASSQSLLEFLAKELGLQ